MRQNSVNEAHSQTENLYTANHAFVKATSTSHCAWATWFCRGLRSEYAIQLSKKNKAGKGYHNHLNFCCGSAPKTAVLKFTFSGVFTGHLITTQHHLQLRERPFLFTQGIEKKSRKTHACPKLDIEKGISLLQLLLTEATLLQPAACLLFFAGGLS